MKREVLKIAYGILFCAPLLLQACLEEATPDESQLSIGTIRVIEGNEYFIELDSDESLYPGDTTQIRNYALKSGQRAFICFNPLEEKMPGYDIHARIYCIENILTKEVCRIPTDATEQAVGDDPINITHLWMANGYLNLQYQLFDDELSDQKHLLNLIVKEEDPKDSDYLTVEFRHHGYQEEGRKLIKGLVSFKLDKIDQELEKKKGLKIRYHSLYNGICHKTIGLE